MSEGNQQKFIEKLKNDKKFRFEFIIGIWSGIISLVLIVALIYIIPLFILNDNSIDSDTIADNETPAVATEQAVEATETEPPYTSAIVNGNEEDFDDEDDEEDKQLKNAETAYATTVVNLRNEPALTASVIGKLKAGDEVTILEYDKEWTKVKYNGTEGYVSTIYLSTEKPTPKPEVTSAPVKTTPKPTATAKPTKTPKKTEKPKKTKTPVRTEKPVEPTQAPTEAPQVTQPPVVTNPPEPTQAPTEAPPATQPPAATEQAASE